MIIFFAGTSLDKKKDPRVAVGHDVHILTTYWTHREKKKRPKILIRMAKTRAKLAEKEII